MDEYRSAALRAEAKGTRALIAELADGTPAWDGALIEETPSRFG